MKKAIPIIAVLLALVSLPLHAQLPELERPNVIPPSPEASKLATYISYPVNLSNGLVQTSIPLYEIVDGETLQPVSAWNEASDVVGCITVYCGRRPVRLIDNIHYITR